jgi:hypothetical protein
MEMTEPIRRRATPSPPLARAIEPLIQVMQQQQVTPDVRAQAQMSRARFAVSQFTSVLVALLTCVSLLIVSLSKMENLQQYLTSSCGLSNFIFGQLNSSLYNNTCDSVPPQPPPASPSIPEYG